MRIVKPGDKIVFDSVSRMSGNADEGCEIYEFLFNTQNDSYIFQMKISKI